MTTAVFWALSVLLYVLLALALRESHGHFRSGWVLDISLATAVWSVACLTTPPGPLTRRARPEIVLWFIASLFMLLTAADARLLYASVQGVSQLRALFAVSIALMLALAVAAWFRRAMTRELLLVLVAISLVLARILVLMISPSPQIDVFTSNTHAADLFLAGRNPYQGTYADIYQRQFDYAPGFVYWPVVVVLQSFAKLLFGDIRMVSVLADVVTGCCLWVMMRRLRVAPLHAAAALLAWLAFPVHLFVLEQAWVDPILVAIVAVTIVCLDTEKWLASAIAVGIGLATKQYFVVFAALWGFWLMRRLGMTAALRLGLASAAVFFLCLLPFLIHDADAFVRMTILVPLRQAFRDDSFSLLAYLYRGGTGPSGSWYVLPAVAALGAWLVRLWRQQAADVTSTELARGAFLVLMWMFLFGKQAFCNYYTFAAFFLWLVMIRPTAPGRESV